MSEPTKPEPIPDGSKSSLGGRVLVVTGLSGAGRSTALKVLEDMNCEAVDNLPIRLMPTLIQQGPAEGRGLAIGIDVRTRDFAADA
ncbi:MAG: RNase adapter RapZ, partial [Alphaproteobacteria bacterium]